MLYLAAVEKLANIESYKSKIEGAVRVKEVYRSGE